MNKIEYMAMSLPYGISVQAKDGYIHRLKAMGMISKECNISGTLKFDTVKPILRPLSDLTKEIFVDGYAFIPIEWFKDKSETMLFEDSHLREIIIKKYDYPLLSCSYRTIRKLVEWHFDIAGLIEKEEAIDYHTLPDFVF